MSLQPRWLLAATLGAFVLGVALAWFVYGAAGG
jgi:hypothetical protein